MTATDAILTSAQMDQLGKAFAQASSQADQTQVGLWTPVYDLLYGFLTSNNFLGSRATTH